MSRLLITGAAGAVGSALWPRLKTEFALRLMDRLPLLDGPPGVEFVQADITDERAVASAMDGVDAIVHLAANPDPAAAWSDLVGPNLDGVRVVLAMASGRAVPKVVFASSCHAAGLYDVDRVPNVDPAWPPRPCCPYGISKVYGEVTGRFFAERKGLHVVNLRLGAVSQRPEGLIGLHFWLSFDDLASAVRGALRAETPYGTYYAASANTRLTWNLQPGVRDLGFIPTDNAEDHAGQVDPAAPGPACYRGAV